jgi:hypothetical protein
MKKINLILIILLLSGLTVSAQIHLVGTSAGPGGTVDIVKWQALDSTSVSRFPSGLEGYLYASSVFDSYSSNYYLGGIASGSFVLFSFNTSTNTPGTLPFNALSNISEIDMSTGKIYTLRMDSASYFSVNEYEISTGTESLLGVIYEPGFSGIVTDAISFDSNNGILYYIGFDGIGDVCIYAVPVRNPDFTWSKTPLITTAPQNNISSVCYDNVRQTIFAMNAEYTSGGSYVGNKVVEINPITGEMTNRGTLEGYPYYLGGSSSFDQNSGSFMVVAFDTAFNEKMIVFNTLDNTFVTGFVPSMVSEIVCDNHDFARSAYLTTAMPETESTEIALYPNPVADWLNIRSETPFDHLDILDIQGRVYKTVDLTDSNTRIQVASLPDGMYLCRLTGKGLTTRYVRMIKG